MIRHQRFTGRQVRTAEFIFPLGLPAWCLPTLREEPNGRIICGGLDMKAPLLDMDDKTLEFGSCVSR